MKSVNLFIILFLLVCTSANAISFTNIGGAKTQYAQRGEVVTFNYSFNLEDKPLKLIPRITLLCDVQYNSPLVITLNGNPIDDDSDTFDCNVKWGGEFWRFPRTYLKPSNILTISVSSSNEQSIKILDKSTIDLYDENPKAMPWQGNENISLFELGFDDKAHVFRAGDNTSFTYSFDVPELDKAVENVTFFLYCGAKQEDVMEVYLNGHRIDIPHYSGCNSYAGCELENRELQTTECVPGPNSYAGPWGGPAGPAKMVFSSSYLKPAGNLLEINATYDLWGGGNLIFILHDSYFSLYPSNRCQPNQFFCEGSGACVNSIPECFSQYALTADEEHGMINKKSEEANASNESECSWPKAWCHTKSKCVTTPLECFEEYKVTSECTSGWPAHEGGAVTLVDANDKERETDYACDIFEVRNPQLRQIARQAIDCCLNSCQFGCHSSCESNRRDSLLSMGVTHARLKSCAARYIIDGLGPRATIMYDYYFPELFCGNFPGFDSPGIFGAWDCGAYAPGIRLGLIDEALNFPIVKHIYNKNARELQCKTDLKTDDGSRASPGGWADDGDMQKNSCVFSNLPAHVSVFKLHTGTCYDYSTVLTTLLRMIGFEKNEVYTISGKGHSWNLVKFPGDLKYTFVDTTGNKVVPMRWHSTPPLLAVFGSYCDRYDPRQCGNDYGFFQTCPAKTDIWGCG